jgi:hypothetical protein
MNRVSPAPWAFPPNDANFTLHGDAGSVPLGVIAG